MSAAVQTVAAAARAIRARSCPGSSVENGKLYHDLPFAGVPALRHHRGGTAARAAQIFNRVDVKDRTVLDIGCGPGGMSIAAALAGARAVVGIDADEQALDVARTASRAAGVGDRCQFMRRSTELPWAHGLQRFDVILWLSQWMWCRKLVGLEQALDVLHVVSRRAGILVFETAAEDGEAGEKGLTQDRVLERLRSAAVHSRVMWQESVGGWHRRRVYFCLDPVTEWRGSTAKAIRRQRNELSKVYPRERGWMLLREANALGRLSGSSSHKKCWGRGFPWLRKSDGIGLCMTWEGWQQDVRPEMADQAEAILRRLQDEDIRHRDIRPANLVAKNGRLALIDFGWALFDEEADTPTPAPACLGTEPDGHRWGRSDGDAMRAIFARLGGKS